MARKIFNLRRPEVFFYGVDLMRDNKIRIERAIIAHLNDVWVQAVQAGIAAMAPLIHVDTGMSVASLLPAARAVHMEGSVSARIAEAKLQKYVRWYYNPGRTSIIKGPEAGEEIGKDSYEYTKATLGNPRTFFRYSINVYHFKMIEQGHFRTPPWGITEAGLTAIRETFHKLWNPNGIKS